MQEINVLYDCGIQIDKVTWHKIRPGLPVTLREAMEHLQNSAWFKEVTEFRNMATHRYIVPILKQEIGRGDAAWDLEVDKADIEYVDSNTQNVVRKDIEVCKEYLQKMIDHVHQVWGAMAEKFQ